MSPRNQPLKVPKSRFGADLARAGVFLAAGLLVANLAESHWPGSQLSLAATNAGTVQVVVPPGAATQGQTLASGGSATQFALTPPVGAACTGDSASGGYRIQSYMVPAAIDPATLTFDANGPLPTGTGAAYRQPLFGGGGSPFINGTTGVATATAPGGLLTGLPPFSFDLFGTAGPAVVPAGIYNLGYACTLGLPSATQLDKFWNVQFTFAADPADLPSGITWKVGVVVAPTTTTVAATTTTVAVTTTTAAATTTTAAPTTTTTPPTTTTPATTTTTTTPAATTTTPAATTTTTTAAATTTTTTPPTTTTPHREHEDRPENECGRGRRGRDSRNGDKPCPRVPRGDARNSHGQPCTSVAKTTWFRWLTDECPLNLPTSNAPMRTIQ